MVIYQTTNHHYEIMDIADIKNSDRYARQRDSRGKFEDTFADSFEKQLDKTIDRSHQTEKGYLDNYPQRKKNSGLERKTRTKDEIKIKPKNRQIEPRKKIDNECNSTEKKQGKTENSYEENLSENNEERDFLDPVERNTKTIPKNTQDIQKDNILGKISSEISKGVIVNKGSHLEGESNKTQQPVRIDISEKITDPNKSVAPSLNTISTPNTEKLAEPLKMSSVLENKKNKENKIEQLMGKKPAESAEAKSIEKSNIALVKGTVSLKNTQVKSDSIQLPADLKNREVAPPSKIINEMAPQDEEAGTKIGQSGANRNAPDIKTNPIELMSNTRTNKIEQNTLTITKADSSQSKLLPEQTVDKIIKNIVYVVKNNQSEIKIDLRPELLGKMQVEIVAKNNRLNINITTDSNIIKEFIENSLNQLRTEFGNYKLSVEDIEVGVNNELSKENDNQKGFEDRQLRSSKGEAQKKEQSMDDQEGMVNKKPEANRSNSMIDYYV